MRNSRLFHADYGGGEEERERGAEREEGRVRGREGGAEGEEVMQ